MRDSDDDRRERSDAEPRGDGDREDPSGSRNEIGTDDDDDRWRFSLDDIEAREADAAAAERRRSEPIERGSPSAENVAFVVLGALFALFVVSRLVVG